MMFLDEENLWCWLHKRYWERSYLAERLPQLGLKSSEAEVDCGHHLVVKSHIVIMPSGTQTNSLIRSAVLLMMSGQQGTIPSSGKVLTLLSRPLWRTSHPPQSVKSSFLSSEICLPLSKDPIFSWCWLAFDETPISPVLAHCEMPFWFWPPILLPSRKQL